MICSSVSWPWKVGVGRANPSTILAFGSTMIHASKNRGNYDGAIGYTTGIK